MKYTQIATRLGKICLAKSNSLKQAKPSYIRLAFQDSLFI